MVEAGEGVRIGAESDGDEVSDIFYIYIRNL